MKNLTLAEKATTAIAMIEQMMMGEDFIGNDSVSTAEGVCIGNTTDQVKTTYGEANPEDSTDDTWVYDKGSSRISIGFTDQKVSSIYYQAKM